MLRNEERDAATIADLLQACEKIVAFATSTRQSDFLTDAKIQSAICFQIAVVGEAVTRLTDSLQLRYPEVPWIDIRGMRN